VSRYKRQVKDVWKRLGSISVCDWAVLAGLTLSSVTAVLHAQSYSGVMIDDAFTTFRHASNLLHGYGFSCNPGERIEGTSSPLFGFAMVLPIALHVEPDQFATWLATIAFVGCVLLAYLTVRSCLRDAASRVLGLGAAITVATSPILAFHSQTGLETLPYACAFTTGLWLFLDGIVSRKASVKWVVAMGVASLLRPEGFLFFTCLLGVASAVRLARKIPLRQSLRELGVFLMVWGPWLLFRLVYFGTFWSNSVLAKSGQLSAVNVHGWSKLRDFLTQSAGTQLLEQFVTDYRLPIVLLVGAVLFAKIRLHVFVVTIMTLSYAAVVIWNGGDWMLHHRLLTPCITPLIVASMLGLRAFLFHREQRNLRQASVAQIAPREQGVREVHPEGTRLREQATQSSGMRSTQRTFAVAHWPSFFVSILVIGYIVVSTQRLPISDPAIKDLPRFRELGRRLALVTRRDDHVVSSMAGILPYYWQANTTDMYGICDAHIAQSGALLPLGIGRYDLRYLVAKNPTFYAFEYVTVAADIFASREFATERDRYFMVQYPFGYLGSKTFSPPTIFVRKDRPELDRVANALGVKLVDAGTELRRIGVLSESRLAP
jgi:hypothetical protein